MSLDFRALGSVAVLRDGQPLALGGVKRRALLAVLMAAPNRVVSTAAIVDAVWEDEPPASVGSAIQVSVSALRGLLGAEIIQTVPPGYRLVLATDQSDVQRFRSLSQQHAQARVRGDYRLAADLAHQALAEWSGRAYQDLAGLHFADDLAARLEEERLATLASRVELDLMLGRHAELVSELAALTAEHSLAESLWGHYMVALYRCGRQADALAAYRRLRETLLDELGLDPSASLRALEAAVLAQDPQLEWRPLAASELALTQRDPLKGVAWVTPEEGVPVVVPTSGLRIGRDPTNDIVVEHPRVSRRHATVVAGPGGYLVVDLHSTNGTRLNGDLVVGEHALADGDRITVGESTLLFSCARSG